MINKKYDLLEIIEDHIGHSGAINQLVPKYVKERSFKI